MSRIVKAALVIAKRADGSDVYVYAGSPLPDGLADGEAQRLADFLDDDAADEGDYKALKAPDLKAEIDRRNEGRDDADLIPSDGNKAELVAALEADDGK